MDKIKVLLVATHKERYYNCLLGQLEENRIPYEVLGYGYDKFNFRWRMRTYINRLKEDPNNIYILIDAFDSLCFTKSTNEIYSKFMELDCDILFAEGGKTKGVNKYIQSKIYPRCKDKQLNFAMVGYGWKMIKMLEAALGPEFGDINEEQYQLSILCERFDRVKIDTRHVIFHVVSNDQTDIKIRDGRVVYIPSGSKPCFITGPGYSDLKQFTNKCYIEPKTSGSMFSWKRFQTYGGFFIVEILLIVLFLLIVISLLVFFLLKKQ